MATHRTYMVTIKADDRFDEVEDGEPTEFAQPELLHFIMNAALSHGSGIEITDLSAYS